MRDTALKAEGLIPRGRPGPAEIPDVRTGYLAGLLEIRVRCSHPRGGCKVNCQRLSPVDEQLFFNHRSRQTPPTPGPCKP